MITPLSVTCLCTYAASTESSNSTFFLGYDDSSNINYWKSSSRFMGNVTTNASYVFGADPAGGGSKTTSIINSPFIIWSSLAFNGGWSMDVYVTYAYTKVL